jgi:transposase
MIKLILSPFLVLFILSCSHSLTTVQDPARPAASLSSETRSKIEEELAQRTKEEENAFAILTSKMDEYQNVLALCESVSEPDENDLIRTTCKERLRTLKRELEDLSGILQGQP